MTVRATGRTHGMLDDGPHTVEEYLAGRPDVAAEKAEAAEDKTRREKELVTARMAKHDVRAQLKREANTARLAEAGAKRKAAARVRALAVWIKDGGTEAEFDTQWDAMYSRILESRAIAGAARVSTATF